MPHTAVLSADRLPDVLDYIEKRGLKLDMYPVYDIPGPGGGVYITHNTPLTAKHVDWLARRSPTAGRATFVEVRWEHKTRGQVEPPDIATSTDDDSNVSEGMAKKARRHAKRVATAASDVADKASDIYEKLGAANFTAADLRKPKTKKSLKQLERGFLELNESVQEALGEYLQGNTLVMDLILRYDLDQDDVRHALSVAAFATEMATILALRQEEDDDLSSYFGEATDAELLQELDPFADPESVSPEDRKVWRRELFRRELAEIFLGGFMHDCGMWTQPHFPPEGHEVKGAMLISEIAGVQKHAPTLPKTVLFHSDIMRLARKHGVVKVTESAEDAKRMSYRRAFYNDRKKADAAAARLANAEVLSASDLRKVLPVALAEHYISQTCDLYTKPELEVINDLASHVGEGLFQRYLVVLCNSRVEAIAPRGALVRLGGHVTLMVAKRSGSRRAVRLEVDGYDAGSLYHGEDRDSPHLITLFIRRPNGRRAKAKYVSPKDSLLWERASGLDHRAYIAAGHFRNSLSYRVIGFMGEEGFGRVLGEYEQVFERRYESGTPS